MDFSTELPEPSMSSLSLVSATEFCHLDSICTVFAISETTIITGCFFLMDHFDKLNVDAEKG